MSDESASGENATQERIKIDIPKVHQQGSDEVWAELEKYIFTGFLVNPAIIHNHNFVFKTLNHYEVKNIEFMKPAKSAPSETKSHFRHCFIAYSIFMIDGVNVLYERQRNLRGIIRTISKIPAPIQDKIVTHLSALNNQAHRLHPLAEIYVQENRSRYRWLQVQGFAVHSPLATGIAGTEDIGMNYSQQTWVALNRLQDKREDMERDWTNAKFIGSCLAGKGVKAVDERDKARHERERVEHEEKKMELLHSYLNRTTSAEEDPKNLAKLPDGRSATIVKRFSATSVEELAGQLSQALNGEKDHHDSVVEAQVNKLRLRSQSIDKNKHKMYELPASSHSSETGSRVLSGKQEADAYLARLEAMRETQVEIGRRAADMAMEQNSDEQQKSGGSNKP